jgi:hypothetical protein
MLELIGSRVSKLWVQCEISFRREFSMSFVSELFRFMRARKKYWLAPIMLVLVLLGGIIVLSQGSAVAPFIYTLF